ncbi:hypothetical protein KKB18_07475 [bacterium]|nr:hypothetical protein [Patescibacteria group bacterium]MBU1627194.1 hypothetical protein [bacterium]
MINTDAIKQMFDLVQSKCRKSIELSGPFAAPSRTAKGQSHLGIHREMSHLIPPIYNDMCQYYRKVLGWIPANPNRQSLKEAIQSVYHFEERAGIQPYNIVNTSDGHRQFLKEIEDHDKRDVIFLMGKKGAGKTFYLNYLFNLYSKQLYEKKIVWYRAELTKLYRYNIENYGQDEVDEKNYMTIEEYFSMHIVYVTFKYRQQNKIFLEMWGDIKGDLIEIAADNWILNEPYYNIDMENDIKQMKDIINKCELKETQLGDSMEFDKTQMEQFFFKNKELCSLMASTILTYLMKKGFVTLLVFDGLDNIDYYQNERFYTLIVNQLKKYCLDDKIRYLQPKIIISLRNETYEHIKSISPRFFNVVPPPTFFTEHKNPIALLKKKIDVAVNEISPFKNDKNKMANKIRQYCASIDADINPQEIVIECDKTLKSFGDEYLDKLLSLMEKLLSGTDYKEPINERFLIERVYNGNIRSFLQNFMNVFLYSILFKEKKQYIKSDREYVYTEGQLLNGSIYIDTKSEEYAFGKCFPNIFYYNENGIDNKWHGLTLYRIMQYLRRSRINERYLIDTIYQDFAYDKKIIQFCIKYGIGHGIIETSYDINKKDLFLMLSQKGELLLQYYFTDVNIFYCLAMDTPLSQCANSKIRFHINDEYGYWVNYIEACTLTSITFARHILQQHRVEMTDFTYDKKAMYELPRIFPEKLIKGIIGQVMILRGFMDKSRSMNLERDINGII